MIDVTDSNCVQILAGNARKIGSVRFERMEATNQSKEENERGFLLLCDVVGEEANGNQDMQESHLRQPLYGRQLAVVEMDDEADESTASIVSKSTDKWEEEEAHLERQRWSDLRRREAVRPSLPCLHPGGAGRSNQSQNHIKNMGNDLLQTAIQITRVESSCHIRMSENLPLFCGGWGLCASYSDHQCANSEIHVLRLLVPLSFLEAKYPKRRMSCCIFVCSIVCSLDSWFVQE
jgi:hypothetical protein